jgi:predicted GIY-YIG superfamily endonuclease
MGKLYSIKDKEYIVYHLLLENYIGVTTNLQKRLYKHSSKSGFCIDNDNVNVLYITNDLREAINKEYELQEIYNCSIGVRNQNGSKNPFAKEVLHLDTGIYFDTIKEACEAFNYPYSSVRHFIKNNNNKYKLIKI